MARKLSRRGTVHAALALLALWAALALARDVRHLQWRHAHGLWLEEEPCLWRYGTPPTDRLEELAGRLGPELARETGAGAESETVYFSSGFAGQEALCAYLWTTFLLPEATLRQAPAGGRPPPGSLWMVFDGAGSPAAVASEPAPGADPGLDPVLATPAGALYRVEDEAAAAPP